MAIERGHAIFNGTQPMEHFGFIDGISQPLFFQSDVNDVAKKTGTDSWEPSAGTKLVLVKDPFMKSDEECGSFYVFRKLEQDVAGFLKREAELQAELDKETPKPHPELAGALVVGRFRDGTPVVKSNVPAGLDNNFRYKGSPIGAVSDSAGKRCPFSSHIRKVNPRGDTDKFDEERMVRIARRGITYGIQGGGAPVGLLFQCCQRDLKSQFEFLQGQWINHFGQPMPDAGLDPIVGELTGSNQQWPAKWDTNRLLALDFGEYVTLKGGGYFFLPSTTFLKHMPDAVRPGG
jgi:Dyp-type peroxidase family